MFVITDPAIEAIQTLLRPGDAGVRISLADDPSDGSGPRLTLERATAPDIHDEVIQAARVTLYIDEDTLDTLEGKRLDAHDDHGAIRFSVRG